MAIEGKIIVVNLVPSQRANEHLRTIAENLGICGLGYELLFFPSDEKELHRILQQRHVYLLYIVAHAEQGEGIVYKDKIYSPTDLCSMFGRHIPRYVFLNCCYGEELDYGAYLKQMGCHHTCEGQGYIEYDMAFKYGSRFFDVMLKYKSATRGMYYVQRLKHAPYHRK